MNELHYVNFVVFVTNSSPKYQNVSPHQIVGNGSWPSGYGVGLGTLGSWVRSPYLAWFRFGNLGNSIYPSLPQYSQL